MCRTARNRHNLEHEAHFLNISQAKRNSPNSKRCGGHRFVSVLELPLYPQTIWEALRYLKTILLQDSPRLSFERRAKSDASHWPPASFDKQMLNFVNREIQPDRLTCRFSARSPGQVNPKICFFFCHFKHSCISLIRTEMDGQALRSSGRINVSIGNFILKSDVSPVSYWQ